MINNEDFALRLQRVIDFYNENASSFAEKIGVQRSSISHILSGRNKPSLDFVMKVLSAFPDVELYWLINGQGQFPLNETDQTEISFDENIKELKAAKPESKINQNDSKNTLGKSIERIVIFYTDGSFKNFEEY